MNLPIAATYEELRPEIRTGCAVAFCALASYCQAREASPPLPALFGLFSNRVIARAQFTTAGEDDGYHRIIHVGMAVHSTEHDELLLAEWTAGQIGPGLHRLSERIATYPGQVLVFWLRPEAQARVDDAAVAEWLRDHRNDAYDYAMLPCAVTRFFPGWVRPGFMYCAPAVISAWQWCGAQEHERRVLRTGGLVMDPVRPQRFSPMRLVRLGVVDEDHPVEILRGSQQPIGGLSYA